MYGLRLQFGAGRIPNLMRSSETTHNALSVSLLHHQTVKLSKNLLPACKPDSVPSLRRAVIIYLSCRLPGGSICLPSIGPRLKSQGLRRAAFNRWYTWHFSMQGLPTMTVARHSRELLPHVFTITPDEGPGL